MQLLSNGTFLWGFNFLINHLLKINIIINNDRPIIIKHAKVTKRIDFYLKNTRWGNLTVQTQVYRFICTLLSSMKYDYITNLKMISWLGYNNARLATELIPHDTQMMKNTKMICK